MKAFINVGCNGRMHKGIIMCSSTHNSIADLRRLRSDQNHIIEYLEKHCKLFDQQAVDLNKIGNIVNLLSREGIIIKQKEQAIYDYIAIHKRCGIYMYIDPLAPKVGEYGE